MINFIVSRGHCYTVKSLLKSNQLHIKCMSLDKLCSGRALKPGVYVFSDIERFMPWELRIASEASHQLNAAGFRVFNKPERVCSRVELLRRLYHAGINDFSVYRADEEPSPQRFPVFVRWEADHGKPLSGLLTTQDELNAALAALRQQGFPMRGLIIVEYCAEPIRDGVFRKYGAYRIGDNVFAHHHVLEDNWNVKYGLSNFASDDDFREELEYVKGNPHREKLQQIFDLAGIEYGRVDYGVVSGRLQVYEINTNPEIKIGDDHHSPIRRESMGLSDKKLLNALADLEACTCSGSAIRLRSAMFKRYRLSRNLISLRAAKRP
jgi:hypothetical protein